MGQISKIELNDQGLRELMNSDGVGDFLEARGHAMAGAASAKSGGEYKVEWLPGKTRARVTIMTMDRAAKKAESESAALRASIDAARTS